jgi:hypothetical protein
MKAGLPRGKTDLSAIRSFNFESDNEGNINGDELSDLSDVFEDFRSEEITSNVPVECISLDDITYDRDLKWINVPNGARPKPVILQGNKFLKQVQTITRDSSSDLHALDDRYAQMDDRKRNHDKKFLVEFDDDNAAKSRSKRGSTRERKVRTENTRGTSQPVRIAKPNRQQEARGAAESQDSSSDDEDMGDRAVEVPAAREEHDRTKGSRRERGGRGRGRDSTEQRGDAAGGRGGRERGGRGKGAGAREIVEDGAQAHAPTRTSRGKPDTRKPRHDFDEQGTDLTDNQQAYAPEDMDGHPLPPARGGRGLRGVAYQHPNAAGRQPRAPRQGSNPTEGVSQAPVLDSRQPRYYPEGGYDYYNQQPPVPPARRGQQQQQSGAGRGGRGGGRRAPRGAQPSYATQEYSAELPYYPDGAYYDPYQYEQYDGYEGYAGAPTEEYPAAQTVEYDFSAYQAGGWEDDGLAAAAAREARLNPQAAAFVPTWMKG